MILNHYQFTTQIEEKVTTYTIVIKFKPVPNLKDTKNPENPENEQNAILLLR